MSEKKFSHPATYKDLKKVIHSLNENKAKYILIGGYALFSHGYHRATEDIDLLIPQSSKYATAITKSLTILEDKESLKLPLEWFDEGENIRIADEIVIDLIFKTCGETYETLLPYIETIYLDDVPVKTLSLRGLLKTKQSFRAKDILDKNILERAIAILNL